MQRPARAEIHPALVVAAAAVAVQLLIGLLARRAAPDPVLTPLLDSGARLYYLAAIASAAGIAVLSVVRGAPPRRPGGAWYWYLGVVPGLAALAGSVFLVWHHGAIAIILVPIAVGAVTFVRLETMQLLAGQRERLIVLDLLAITVFYLLAAMILSLGIRTFHEAAVIDSLLVGIAAGVVVYSRLGMTFDEQRAIRAAGIGLIAGQLVWALNYLDMSHWVSAIPVAAIGAIGGWMVRRDERTARERPTATSPASDPGSSRARQGP